MAFCACLLAKNLSAAEPFLPDANKLGVPEAADKVVLQQNHVGPNGANLKFGITNNRRVVTNIKVEGEEKPVRFTGQAFWTWDERFVAEFGGDVNRWLAQFTFKKAGDCYVA